MSARKLPDNNLLDSPSPNDLNNSQFDSSLLDEINNDGIDFKQLNKDQKTTEKTLDFLLKYKCTEKRTGKGKGKGELKLPSTVKESLKTIENISDLHGGVLLDYLMKVCKLNKQLLQSLEKLDNKYNDLISKYNDIKKESETAVVIPPTPVNTNSEPTPQADITENFELKIDDLEQKNNANILICNGDLIKDLVSNNTNYDDLNTAIRGEVRNIHPDLKTSDITKIVPHGREKKSVKLYCSSLHVKNLIIHEARRKKPENVYFSEFLTQRRFRLFFELRQLKKNNPGKIYAVYIRNGNIYYKVTRDDNHSIIKSKRSIDELKSNLNIE